MRNFVLTLTFVSSLLISFLPCRAQFNTVTRDTVPIRLIGQPAPTGKVGAVSGEEHGSAAVSSEGSTPLGSEEKFYEMPVMPGLGQGRGGGTQGKEGVVGQDGIHGLSTGAYGQGVVGQGQQDRPQGAMGQEGQQEGRKGFFRRLFGKSSKRGDDGGNRSRGIFGRRRRQAPQVIIMPIQTVGNDVAGMSVGAGGRERIDEYSERVLDPHAPLARLFKDVSRIARFGSEREIESMFYRTASFIQNTDSEVRFWDIFSLDEMVAHVESLVKELGLKYRILRLCGGDMSFTSAITYDFELMLAFLGVEGWDKPMSSIDEIAEEWHSNRVPVASNIQFVFYRNKKDDILVRVLYNERDIELPIGSAKAPFYSWPDFKAFCDKQIALTRELVSNTNN